MRRILLLACTLLCTAIAAQAQYVTLIGTISGTNGVTAQDYTLSFTPNQTFYVAGTAIFAGTTTYCATSIDGSVVGVLNPLSTVTVTPEYTSGTLPAGNYYVEYAFYAPGTTTTLVGAEQVVQLTSTGGINIDAPAQGVPAAATGMSIYIGTTSGGETLQGQTTGNNSFQQTVPLVAGAAVPPTNTTVCKQIANDAGWPTGTGYRVSLYDSNGNVVPNYPTLWQLLGPNTTINLSNGLPEYNGIVTYPSPLLASPYNHNTQSISSALNFSGYNILNVGKIGVGTATPAFSIDVASGYINSYSGFVYQGGLGTVGGCLIGYATGFGIAYAPGSCGTPPTVFYQHLQLNGALKPQEPYFNFSSRFTAADNPGSTRTDVDLNTSGVTAGNYTSSNISVDGYGRVTAAANGPAIPTIKETIINSGICTTGTTAYAQCTVSATWGTAFADSAYALTCTPFTPSALTLSAIWISAKSASGFTVTIQNGDSSGANAVSLSEIDCIAMHP